MDVLFCRAALRDRIWFPLRMKERIKRFRRKTLPFLPVAIVTSMLDSAEESGLRHAPCHRVI